MAVCETAKNLSRGAAICEGKGNDGIIADTCINWFMGSPLTA